MRSLRNGIKGTIPENAYLSLLISSLKKMLVRDNLLFLHNVEYKIALCFIYNFKLAPPHWREDDLQKDEEKCLLSSIPHNCQCFFLNNPQKILMLNLTYTKAVEIANFLISFFGEQGTGGHTVLFLVIFFQFYVVIFFYLFQNLKISYLYNLWVPKL